MASPTASNTHQQVAIVLLGGMPHALLILFDGVPGCSQVSTTSANCDITQVGGRLPSAAVGIPMHRWLHIKAHQGPSGALSSPGTGDRLPWHGDLQPDEDTITHDETSRVTGGDQRLCPQRTHMAGTPAACSGQPPAPGTRAAWPCGRQPSADRS